MHERCARPPDGASRTLIGNSGRVDLIRRMIQSEAPPAEAIARLLPGTICVASVRAQIEASHCQRLSADVLLAALQILPPRVVDACLDAFLSPIGRLAVALPGSRPGSTLEAVARVTAEVGDVARVALLDPAAKAAIRKEAAEAIEALHQLIEVVS